MSTTGEKKPDKTEETQEEAKKEDNHSKAGSETPRDSKKEYFKEELKRLKNGLKKEADKIVAPPVEDHVPYTHNSLAPYYNVFTAAYLIEKPEEMPHGYLSRKTAIGLCDPWTNHRMDIDVAVKPDQHSDEQKTPRKDKDKDKDDKRPPKEGSTRLPKFPAVDIVVTEVKNDKLTYADVPKMREMLKEKTTGAASSRVTAEYERTKQDFYRMELDKIDEYHPTNRGHMRATYFAYLQNNKGAKKAVYECVRSAEKTSS